MRYSRSVCFLVVSVIFVFCVQTLALADEESANKSVANKPTTFLLFNTTPGGTYQVEKNSAPLATLSSSFFGVLVMNDVATTGDQYFFYLDGVNPVPPSAPTGLTALGDNAGCADLAWNANPEPDIVGYTIFFDTLSVDQGQISDYRDSVQVGLGTFAQLCNFPDNTYHFALKARNAFGLSSPYSAEVSTTVTNEPTQPPLPPQGVAVSETGPGCATVSWQPNGEPDLAGYMVYYGPQSVEGGQATSYTDSLNVNISTSREICNFAPGTYYFAVKAYNASSEFSAYSAERPVDITNVDGIPPTASITSPADGDVVVGGVTVFVTANDNVGVVGVRLRVDGIDVGGEDTVAPYELPFDTPSYSDGPHTLTAIARDAAGNTATSTGVVVIVDNDADANHPALLLSGSDLADLRLKACFDDNGDPIPACQSSADWTTFAGFVSNYVSAGSYTGMRAWHFALVYKITKDAAYAQRAIALLETEMSNGMSGERASEYAGVHEFLRDAALVYDWLNIFLDAGQKAATVGYMNQLLTEVWNPSNNPYNTWSGTDIENPGSYRYYRFLTATCYVGLAAEGENPSPPSLPYDGNTYTDIVDFVMAKTDGQAIAEWLDTYGVGGAWHEGDEMALAAKTSIADLFSRLRDDGRRDYYSVTGFPVSALYQHLYTIQPGDQLKYPGGDLIDDTMLPVGELDRMLMLHMALGLTGIRPGEYAQHWLNNQSPAISSPALYPWDFLLARSNLPSADFSEMSTNFMAPGLGWMNSRSSWNSDAVSLSFVCGDHLQASQHGDQNSFVIYRDDWLAIDAATYANSGVLPKSDLHNTILVDGFFQRSGAGTGTIDKFEGNAEFTYVVGNAGDAYYQGDKGAGGQRLLNRYLREVVHIQPDYVIVFDRLSAVDTTATLTYLLQTRSQPVINGNEVVAVNGGGKLFQQTLLPENANITPVQELGGPSGLNSWKVEITPQTPAANTVFMNVLHPATTATQTMPNAQVVYATTGNMVGVRIDDGADDIVIMFSTDPAGAPPDGGVIYDVSYSDGGQHLLMGMPANAEFAVEMVRWGEIQTITISPGRGYRTTGQGVLSFNLEEIMQEEISLR